MKLAFISDIHSNIHSFKEVIKRMGSLSVDEIFCLGDIVGYAAYPKECLDLLIENNVFSIMGNHDFAVFNNDTSWFSDKAAQAINYCRSNLGENDLEILGRLNSNKLVRRDGLSFYITHGSPRDNLFEYIHPWVPENTLRYIVKNVNADIIVLGHTHIQMEVGVDNKKILNPGSVGQPRDGIPRACFMVFDTEGLKSEWIRIKYDINSAACGIYDNDLPHYYGDRLFEGK